MSEFSRIVNKSMLCSGKITISTDEATSLNVIKDLLGASQETPIILEFQGNRFNGKVARREGKKRGSPYIELSYGMDLCRELKKNFIHTFLSIYSSNNKNFNKESIKFKTHDNDVIKITVFTCIQSVYDEIFKQLIGLNLLDFDNETKKLKSPNIIVHSEEWIDKRYLSDHILSNNVVYYLCDEKNKQIYIGSCKVLWKRLSCNRKEIPDWNKFRYDIINPEYAYLLPQIELFAIRSYSNILETSRGYKFLSISDYKLININCGR